MLKGLRSRLTLAMLPLALLFLCCSKEKGALTNALEADLTSEASAERISPEVQVSENQDPESELDRILGRSLESRGGREAWESIKSARMTGKMSMGGIVTPITVTYKLPGKVRFEAQVQGQTMVQAYDGETGWNIVPATGQNKPTVLRGEQLKQVRRMADFAGPLVDYRRKGHRVELTGQENIDGKEAYRVKLTTADGDVIHNYLDTERHLLFKQETAAQIQGQEIVTSAYIGDYKAVGPILLAHSLEQLVEGRPAGMTLTVDHVELDVAVDDAIFVVPTTATAGE